MWCKAVSGLLLVSIIIVSGCGSDELPPEELTVTGIVMQPDGGQVNGATVLITDANTIKQVAIGRTDTQGRFAIRISPGNYIAFARGERKDGSSKRQMEGMSELFRITPEGALPRMTVQLYDIVLIRSICPLTEEEVEAHAEKKGLVAFFSTQKFRELGIKEGQIVKINNRSTRQDIVVYAFQADSILCEASVPSVIIEKLFAPYAASSSSANMISTSLEVSITAPELFR